MKHMVITIGCEYGAGGPEIGKRISDVLGIKYYDRDLVDQVVEQIGVDKELVQRADAGSNVLYSFETQYGPRFANLTNRVIFNQFEVIKKLAENASCVLIGRCSNYILKERRDCLNFFVYAPEEVRIQSVMEREKVSRKQADELVKYHDEMLHARYKYMTGSYRGDRKGRHMMIDSSVLGREMTARYMLQMVDLRFPD
ncbi:cytidylate kinase-like family protein [Blautia marasmi]|uniref:cytidylate kinase-like family protein n=1 Tax=Blautia marasmi TaxID=1917868 RepID=UPI000CF1FE4D|nr:cytidylate kinase-like family protein [Blautia marasmi]